jgi:hypothetical protein
MTQMGGQVAVAAAVDTMDCQLLILVEQALLDKVMPEGTEPVNNQPLKAAAAAARGK